MSRKTLIQPIIQLASQLIRGEVCLSCGREWRGQAEICESCLSLFPRIDNACVLCGLTNRSIEQHPLCPGCLIDPPPWQAMMTAFHYSGPIRRFLLQAKFAADLPPLKSLCLGHAAFDQALHPLPEVLMPVPLHNERLRQRGFNQAEEIARFWSSRFDIPLDRTCLQRIRDTRSQSGLNKRLRQQNIRQAFACNNPGYRHVALVDDIITTGATISEMTRLLQQQGVEFVEVWALARACRKQQSRLWPDARVDC